MAKKLELFTETIKDKSDIPALKEKALVYYRPKGYNAVVVLSKEVEDGFHVVFIPGRLNEETGKVEIDEEIKSLAEDSLKTRTFNSSSIEPSIDLDF
jgi:hypothetical protein